MIAEIELAFNWLGSGSDLQLGSIIVDHQVTTDVFDCLRRKFNRVGCEPLLFAFANGQADERILASPKRVAFNRFLFEFDIDNEGTLLAEILLVFAFT